MKRACTISRKTRGVRFHPDKKPVGRRDKRNAPLFLTYAAPKDSVRRIGLTLGNIGSNTPPSTQSPTRPSQLEAYA